MVAGSGAYRRGGGVGGFGVGVGSMTPLITLLVVTLNWDGRDAVVSAIPYPDPMVCGAALETLPLPDGAMAQCEVTGVLSASPVPRMRNS